MTVDESRGNSRYGSRYTSDAAVSGPVGTLAWPQQDWPRQDWPHADVDDHPEFSAEPRITYQDLRAALGPQVDQMMVEADVDADELIRLVNAQTTVLPVIPDVPDTPGGLYVDEALTTELPVVAEPEPEESGLGSAVKQWKRRFLKGAVAAVLLTLTGGGASALAMNKSVTVEVDGQEQTVRSFGSTVGDVLDDAGISVGAHDALSPSPDASVSDGGVISLERGRQLELTVDGEKRESWVRATTVDEALGQLGLGDMLEEGAWVSESRRSEVPLDGMTLEVKSLKNITVVDGAGEPQQLTTHAVTVQELLEELGLELGSDDEVAQGVGSELTDGEEVRINRTGTSEIEVTEEIEAPVEEVEDTDLGVGERVVEEEGESGEKLVTYRVTQRNGEEVAREEVGSEVLSEPEPKVVRVGPENPPISDEAVWERLAHCESTNNWSINTGNGYYGGLQFDKPTWDEYGGTKYAAYPHQASRAQQIAIATKLRDARGGYSAWPACAEKLGLPT
ncbi:ubiquitin-like domain-containing protein [Haloechinothrix aidingensis]